MKISNYSLNKISIELKGAEYINENVVKVFIYIDGYENNEGKSMRKEELYIDLKHEKYKVEFKKPRPNYVLEKKYNSMFGEYKEEIYKALDESEELKKTIEKFEKYKKHLFSFENVKTRMYPLSMHITDEISKTLTFKYTLNLSEDENKSKITLVSICDDEVEEVIELDLQPENENCLKLLLDNAVVKSKLDKKGIKL